MGYTLPRFVGMIQKNSADKLFRPEHFEDRESKVLDVKIRTVSPVIRFDDGEVKFEYNVGTRGNGVDQPRWPADLMSEAVT